MTWLLAGLILGQAKPQAHSKVDQDRVDQAIEKGCKWLLGQKADVIKTFGYYKRHQPEATQSRLEIVVLTLAHSGYAETDPDMAALIAELTTKKIQSTYTASLQAMALAKIDAKKYQWRIAQCAQFLVDNQADNGQWDYGEETKTDDFKPPARSDEPVVATETTKPAVKIKKYGSNGSTQLLPKVQVRKKRKGPPAGDNSNSQYAALGVRACMDSGIVIEKEVLQLARRWWVSAQCPDGGWGYMSGGDGWGGMTVGGVGALCIYNYFLGEDYKSNKEVLRGMEWLTKNFNVKSNPKEPDWMKGTYDLYYLYGLERVGILYGTESFGPNEWYPAGAHFLLDIQKPSGEWNHHGAYHGGTIADTCFAILFLRRATRPLLKIATGEGRK